MKNVLVIFVTLILALNFTACDTPQVSESSNISIQESEDVTVLEDADLSIENDDFGLQGRYTILNTGTDGERPQSFEGFLEFTESVIIVSYISDLVWNVEQFDLVSGDSVCLLESTIYSDKGQLYGIDYAKDHEGYDYCLLFENGILYRSSIAQETELFEDFPEGISPKVQRSYLNNAPYHRSKEYYLWADNDGINISRIDGSETTCILPNKEISSIFSESEYVAAYESAVYDTPRFVNSVTGVIAQVINKDGDFIGIVSYSLADNKVILFVESGPPNEARIYPAMDRYIGISRGTPQIIDTYENIISLLPLEYYYYSYDCERFIEVEISSPDFDDFKAFLSNKNNFDDVGELILSSEGSTGVYISGISENHIFVTSMNADKFWLAMAAY